MNLTALDEDSAASYIYSADDNILILIVVPAFLAASLMGNLAFLFVVYRIPQMRTISNFYLANLAVADIAYLCVVCCRNLAYYFISPIRGDVPFQSSIGCILVAGSTYTCYFASIFLVTLVGMERFFAICLPIVHRRVSGRSRTIKLVVATWFIAVCFAAAQVPSSAVLVKDCIKWPPTEKYADYPEITHYCSGIDDNYYLYSNIIQVSPFFASIVANSVFYVSIVWTLNRSAQSFGSADRNQPNQAAQARNQVTRLLFVNASVFFLCQAPFQVAVLLGTTDIPYLLTNEQFEMFFLIARILIYLNSTVNPIVYTITSPRYRKACWKAFGFDKEERRPTGHPGSITTVTSRVPSRVNSTNQTDIDNDDVRDDDSRL